MGRKPITAGDRERGKRILAAYKNAGMTRRVFADKLGRYYHDVARLEGGQKPDPETLRKISDICGVTERWLVRGPYYSAQFKDWLANGAPADLHDLEREILGAVVFPETLHPGPQWYSVALGAWRMGTGDELAHSTQVRKPLRAL